MHRDDNIIEEITEYGNVSSAIDRILHGTVRKKSRQGRELLDRREEFIADFQRRIRDGTWRIKHGYREREIKTGAKTRRIQILTYADGAAVSAIMDVVDRYIYRRLIRTTSASVKGRGIHEQKALIERAIRHHPEETKYCYSWDIRKCYDTTPQDRVKEAVRHIIKDKKLLPILDHLICMMPKGMSIGMRASPGFVNLLLSIHLDHVIKDKEGYKYYYRYCDNGQVFCSSKKECWRARDILHACLEPLGYEIHHESVRPTSLCVDALGFVIGCSKTKLRKRIKKNFARKLGRVKSRKRRKVLIASFYGMARHGSCSSLFKKITGKDMKSFSELGLAYRPKDGKKRFNAETVRLSALTNLKIVVKDFETGVTTAQGEDRCIVLIEHEGTAKKFFTRSEEMIDILEQARDAGVLPFEATIRSESFGKGKIKYSFT